jgi:hypothetical protein
MEKCRARTCKEVALRHQPLCQVHWMKVPWPMRRKLSKMLRKNDLMAHSFHNGLASTVVAYVNKLEMAARRPLPGEHSA